MKFFEAGGSVADNIARWKRQMGDPGNQPQPMTVGDLKITKIAMDGTYTGMGPTGGAAPSLANSRFLGAIIETRDGKQVQVRLNGPREIVEPVEAEWNAMIAGVQAK